MSAKQKITLYVSSDLHRQFKIRSAVDGETMSSIAERAIGFYLENSSAVDAVTDGETYGQTYRVHSCPRCAASVTLNEDKLALISNECEQSLEGMNEIGCAVGLGDSSLERDGSELIGCS